MLRPDHSSHGRGHGNHAMAMAMAAAMAMAMAMGGEGGVKHSPGALGTLWVPWGPLWSEPLWHHQFILTRFEPHTNIDHPSSSIAMAMATASIIP